MKRVWSFLYEIVAVVVLVCEMTVFVLGMLFRVRFLLLLIYFSLFLYIYICIFEVKRNRY